MHFVIPIVCHFHDCKAWSAGDSCLSSATASSKHLHSTFTFYFLANVNSRSRSLYAVARLSVVCLSVCRLSRSCTLLRRLQFSAIFLWHLVPWPSVTKNHRKFYGYRPRGTPPAGELNTRGLVKYSDLDLSKAISRKRCKMGGKLVLLTYSRIMSFQLVSKSVTLNDLERLNGCFCVISATSIAFSAHCVN